MSREHRANFQGLFIILRLAGKSFLTKKHFLVKMALAHQPDSDKRLKIVKKRRQYVLEVCKGNNQ